MTAPSFTDRKLLITRLSANPRNPNRHPDAQIERLMAALEHDGQTRPVLARKANLMLIAGHGVYMAAQRLGWLELQVRVLDVDQPTADRIMLADNRFGELSSRDPDRVAELLREIDSDIWLTAGYTDEEAERLLKTSVDIPVREIPTSAVEDTFWISVRGPLKQQAVVLSKLKAMLTEYPTVDVELGTIQQDVEL